MKGLINGVEIEAAGQRCIKLDFDIKSKRKVAELLRSRLFIFSFFRLDPMTIAAARTRRGWHLRLAAPALLRDEDISFIQLALGSDFIRESLNWRRLKWGIRHWNILFTEKQKNGKTTRETPDWKFTAELRKALYRAYITHYRHATRKL